MKKQKLEARQEMSARIKKVIVELHNYSFFHSPSGTSDIDTRFVGRQKLISKLKMILQDTDTKSGAYLITGYKGMGKSSFVNKVLNEVGVDDNTSIFALHFFRILPALFFLQVVIKDLLVPDNVTAGAYLCSKILTLGTLSQILYVRSKYRKSERRQKGSAIKKFGAFLRDQSRVLKDITLCSYPDRPNTRIGSMIQIGYQVLLIDLVAHAQFAMFPHCLGKATNWKFLLVCAALYFIVNSLSIVWQQYQNIRQDSRINSGNSYGPGQFRFHLLGTTIQNIIQIIKTWYLGQRRICIRISLGYDDLKELDVLRLVARSVQNRYRKIRWDNFPVGLLRFSVLILVISMFYYSPPIIKITSQIKYKTGFNTYFPSQGKATGTQPANWSSSSGGIFWINLVD